ncbi:MAG TPA: GntR family transcriptional regulator [Alphaproteobacteria bacterium]
MRARPSGTVAESLAKIERPRSLTDLVCDHVRASIVEGRLQLGAAVSENALAATLGISKTPVREALLRLKAEGLIEVLPQKGSFVFKLRPEEVAEICELRAILEREALRLACRRDHESLAMALADIVREMGAARAARDFDRYRELDAAFHRAIFERCGNRLLVGAYNGIVFKVQALRTRLAHEPEHVRRADREHHEIVRLVREGKFAHAGRLLAAHVLGTSRSYQRAIGKSRPADGDG